MPTRYDTPYVGAFVEASHASESSFIAELLEFSSKIGGNVFSTFIYILSVQVGRNSLLFLSA